MFSTIRFLSFDPLARMDVSRYVVSSPAWLLWALSRFALLSKPVFIALLSMVFALWSAQAQAQTTVDNALSFDGANDYVSMNVPTPLQYPDSNDFTILTWVRLSSPSNFQRILFAQQSTSNFVSIARNTGDTLYAYVVANGNTYSLSTTSSVGPADTWIHVAVVWKAASRSVAIFINGVQASGGSGGSSSSGTSGQMTLGSRPDGAQLFSGSIDQLAVYGSALSDALILRAATQCVYPPGATNSYSFDEGTANGDNAGVTTLTDDAGNAPGTLHNFALSGTVSNWVDSNISSLCQPPEYIVGGSVSGLTGSGLTLQLNGANDLPIAADGAFQFPAMADGSSYAVTVSTQPSNPEQKCTVSNGSGTLASSDISSVQVTCGTTTPPDAPTNAVATPGNGQATVTWSAPANNGGTSITTYVVTGSPGGTCSVSGAPPATACIVPNLTNGTAYIFSVVATNIKGDSEPSAQSNPVTPSTDLAFVGAGPSITLAPGTVGQAYSAQIAVTGGLPPYAFTFTGNLPQGLSLNPVTGAITGTPTKVETANFSIAVSDSTVLPKSELATLAKDVPVHTVTQNFSITVTAASVTPVPALNAWGLMLISVWLGIFTTGRMRQRQNR